MPESSHSTDSGPWYRMSFSARMIASKSTPPAAERAELPAATVVAKRQVAGENSAASVERHDGIFHMHVIDPVPEPANELDRTHTLPMQVAGVEIETELGPSAQGLDRPLRRVNVERDLRRMDFMRELHSALGKHIQNRIPAFGQQLKALIDPGVRHGGK